MNLEKTIKKLENILKEKELNELKRETLVKLINLFNNTNKENFNAILIDNIKKTEKYEDLMIPQLNSIISDFKNKYDRKIILEGMTIYVYKEYQDFFIKEDYSYEILENEIKKIENKKEEIKIINNSNKSKIKITKIENLKNEIDKINENEYRIRVELN